MAAELQDGPVTVDQYRLLAANNDTLAAEVAKLRKELERKSAEHACCLAELKQQRRWFIELIKELHTCERIHDD